MSSTADGVVLLRPCKCAKSGTVEVRNTERITGIGTLNEVARIIGERQEQYGPPEEHWADTAAIASVLLSEKLREPLSAGDWAKLMVVDKLVRDKRGVQFDNAADIAGYAVGLGGLPERS